MRKGWHKATLGELCKLENGDRGKNYPGRKAFVYRGIPFINAGHLNDGKIDWQGMDYIPHDRFELLGNGKIKKYDLLFCLRGSLGKFGIVDRDLEGAIASSLVIVRTGERLDHEFLSAYFRSGLCAEMISKHANGAAQPNLSAKSLKEFELPLPPLTEQKRIVAILDEAFAGIDAAIANTQRNLANARELFESYLNSMFSRRDQGWQERAIGDKSLLQIEDGDRGKNYPKKSDFTSEGYCLFLNTKNVRPDGFKFDSLMFISRAKDEALRKGKLRRRDVLLTTRGTIGNVAIYDDSVTYDNIRINSGMLILRPNEGQILSEFLFEMLRSSIFKRQVEQFFSGAAQPQLPIKTLVNFTIPVPENLDEQRAAIADIRELEIESRRLESIYQKKLAALAELKQSLLQKAFSGDLTAKVADNASEEAVA